MVLRQQLIRLEKIMITVYLNLYMQPPSNTDLNLEVLIPLGVVGIVLLIVFFFSLNLGLELLRAYLSGTPIKLMQLITLKLQKIPVRLIVDARITLFRSGLDVSVEDLSAHYLAGGRVNNVVTGMLTAKEKNINLSFDHACAIDLEDKLSEEN